MRSIFSLAIIILALSFTAFAQEDMKDQAKPTEQDKTAAIPSDSYLKRGAPVGNAKKVSLNKAQRPVEIQRQNCSYRGRGGAFVQDGRLLG
ncbi:MAG: hypothetical protein IPK98_01130 [Chloracidobacterium sp.]|nr:hypothetical protein [Chloracidobacterium sp.]